MIEKLIVLIGLHFIADFALQNDFQAKFKGSNKYIMLAHCFIWSFCIYVGLWVFGLQSIPKFVFLISGHNVIDSWKCSIKDKSNALTLDLYKDQLLHLLQILFVVYF